MTEKEKLTALEEIMDLEEDTLHPTDVLADIEEWDSLSALSYVMFMNEKFNRNISGQQIRAFKTVEDILDTMGSA